MPLSATGLREGSFTSLRVLKNGVMQDVLSLTSAGAPDIPLGSLSIAQMYGLQAQLNAKATIAALTAAADSLGGEIDALDVSVRAVANAVSATSAALVAKASLVQLSAINTSLSSQLNTVSTFLATKASTTALTTGLAGKQDLLTDSLTLGGLTVSGGDVAFLQHNTGIAFQNDNAQTYAVFELAGATLGRLVVQGELVAANHYNRVQVDELLGTYAYRLPDGAVGISKIYDLQRLLDDNAEIRAAILGQLGNVAGLVSFTRDDLTDLTAVVNGKQGTFDSTTALDVGRVTAGSLTITHPSSSSSAVPTADIGSGISYARFTHGHHLDCYTRGSNVGRALYLNYYANDSVRCGNNSGKLGINMDPGNFQLDVSGNARISGSLSASNFPSNSDERLKVDVESVSLDECTRLVRAVTPCTYKRRDMEGTPARCGYIAQHWESPHLLYILC